MAAAALLTVLPAQPGRAQPPPVLAAVATVETGEPGEPAWTSTIADLLSPDARLRAAAQQQRAGNLRGALEMVDALLSQQPDFRAAHLLRAELLATLAGGRVTPPAEPALEQLSEELDLRLGAPQPPSGEVPSALLALAPEIRHLIAVDLSRHRLYVLENRETGLRVVRNFYASIGSAGYGKEMEGDNRTPVGIYRVTRWLNDERLPELYGDGAFPVDYPNEWDRWQGRNGYGIWLHGVPRESYARLPRSSEGCVTIANTDLQSLRDFITVGTTPVLLATRLDWQPRETVRTRSEAFLNRVHAWRDAWSAGDTEAYLAYYADDFDPGNGMSRADFVAHKHRVNAAKDWIEVRLEALSAFDYPGEPGMRLVRFVQDYRSSNYRSKGPKRQYWRQDADGRWRIFREVSG